MLQTWIWGASMTHPILWHCRYTNILNGLVLLSLVRSRAVPVYFIRSHAHLRSGVVAFTVGIIHILLAFIRDNTGR
ncbi:hypothetical protein BGW80DRAFT_1367134 [Lactifluus volemus]|nr:hypothetical protein BGW80DRAFT_1367134 [Lactifluus volemus]